MKKTFGESVRDFVNEWSLNIVILLFGTTTLVQAFIVPTPSMDTTVMVGDHLLVDKLSYAPPGAISRYLLPYTEVKRGDIIVFRYPEDIRQNYVKRVMGIPGDRIRLEGQRVIINGKKIEEPYVKLVEPPFRQSDEAKNFRDNFPAQPWVGPSARGIEALEANVKNGELVVPPGQYFAMGDNRLNSLDSRYWGFVPRENIIGKPLLIFWSYDAETKDLVDYTTDHFIDLAKNFFSKTRWDRELKLVRGVTIEP
jgi:signal peptidase I